jgi:hypothetical protein
MGINMYRTVIKGNFLKIDSDIFDLFYPEFVVKTTEVCIEKKDLKKLIKKEKDKERKEILKKILNEFGDDEVADFTMG